MLFRSNCWGLVSPDDIEYHTTFGSTVISALLDRMDLHFHLFIPTFTSTGCRRIIARRATRTMATSASLRTMNNRSLVFEPAVNKSCTDKTRDPPYLVSDLTPRPSYQTSLEGIWLTIASWRGSRHRTAYARIRGNTEPSGLDYTYWLLVLGNFGCRPEGGIISLSALADRVRRPPGHLQQLLYGAKLVCFSVMEGLVQRESSNRDASQGRKVGRAGNAKMSLDARLIGRRALPP